MPQRTRIARRREAAVAQGSADFTAKRNELIRGAAMLFKEKGYEATTLKDIAECAGLDRSTIYYYIESKEEVFQEAVKGILYDNVAEAEHLVRLQAIDPRERLRRLIERLMVSYEESYPYMHVYIQQDMQKVADEMSRQTHRFEKAFMTLINEGIEQRVFRSDIPVGLAANAIFGMVNWTHRWHKPDGKQTAREIADAFCKIYFEGMQEQKSPGPSSLRRNTRADD
jgi:AcrR family transcriptional regulator